MVRRASRVASSIESASETTKRRLGEMKSPPVPSALGPFAALPMRFCETKRGRVSPGNEGRKGGCRAPNVCPELLTLMSAYRLIVERGRGSLIKMSARVPR